MRKLYSLLNNKLRYFGFYLAILILIATGLEILSLALVIPAVSFFFDNSIAEKFPIIFSFLVKVSPLNFFLTTQILIFLKKQLLVDSHVYF